MRVHHCVLLAATIGVVGLMVVWKTGHGTKHSPRQIDESTLEVVKDLPYGGENDADPEWHKLDLYVPKGRRGFPAMVFIHGGSWVHGSKEEYRSLGVTLARNGVGTAVINYRLSPDFKHPAHTRDAARALAWTRANIGRFGGRPDQIFVCGHSAGGHIAALLGTDESYLKSENLSFADLRGVIPVSGDYLITRGRWDDVFGNDEEVIRRASPLNVIEGHCPPFLILYAEGDSSSVGRHSDELREALKAMQNEASSIEVKDRTHASIIRNLTEPDDLTMRLIREFMARHAGPETKPGAD